MNDMLGDGGFTLARKLGANGAEKNLKGIYKIFYRIGSPEFIIKRAAKVFATYYDKGEFTTISNKDGEVRFRLTDFPDLSECWIERIAGWMEKTLELSGGKNPRALAIIKHNDSGDVYCEFTATWE